MSMFFHEELYRTSEGMKRLQEVKLTICGAGALGGNLTENLAKSGVTKLKVIDCDRIEERNLSTQPYFKSDVGSFKAKILVNHLYRALGVTLDGITKKLTPDNTTSLLKGSEFVIDTFDNSEGREAIKTYCLNHNLPCFHIGLSPHYSEMIWEPHYRVPSPVNDDICDYPLARNLVMMTVAIASETIIHYLLTQEQKNYSITFNDFSVQPLNF